MKIAFDSKIFFNQRFGGPSRYYFNLFENLNSLDVNTFIVSHDWNHPLIPRINIIKEHHISRIEND